MEKQYVATSDSPTVIVETDGDLRLKGQDELEVVAKSDVPEDLTLDAQGDQVTIRCTSNCNMRVPRQAVIQVQAVQGNAVIKALDGVLTIDTVGGNVELRNVGETKIGGVSGELSAKNVAGKLTINTVAGNASVRGVQGDFAVTDSVNGNLNLSDVSGDASAAADGNITLRLDPAPGHKYDFKSDGNIFCRFSEDASVEINIPKAAQVMPHLPGIHASAAVQTPYALTLGEGDAQITLTADGNVILDTHAPDWGMDDFDVDVGSEVNGMAEAINEQITQQVESQVRMIEEQLNAQLSSLSMRLGAAKLSEDQVRRVEDRAREASDRAAARAQERIRRAQERLEQKLAAAQRKMEYKAHARERAAEHTSRHGRHSWSFGFPTPPTPSTPPIPPSEPVSEEERLMILRLLEQKKISTEQAEELLSALEDKE